MRPTSCLTISGMARRSASRCAARSGRDAGTVAIGNLCKSKYSPFYIKKTHKSHVNSDSLCVVWLFRRAWKLVEVVEMEPPKALRSSTRLVAEPGFVFGGAYARSQVFSRQAEQFQKVA